MSEKASPEPPAATSRPRRRQGGRDAAKGDDAPQTGRTRARNPNPARGDRPIPTAAETFTEAALAEFLDLTAQGVGRDLAARAIGSTGSVMRSYCRAERDPDFAARYAEAKAAGNAFYADRLRAQARTLALSTETVHPRILQIELATHVPEYAHLRRDRVQHEHAGTVTHAIRFDPAVLDELPLDELEKVRDALAILAAQGGDVIDGEARELTA